MPPNITEVEFYRAVSPLSQPIADSTHSIPEIGFIVTRIRTEGDTVGESYLLAFHYSPNAIAGALKDVAELAEGWDAGDPGGFRKHFDRESEYFGNPGVHRWALGAVEIAMWDAWARLIDVPVWKLAGAERSRPVHLYGSGGWLSYSDEELIDEATRYEARGFKAVKVKVGSALERDVERLTRVREAVGSAIEIMMDANQGLDVESAIQLAKRVDPLGISWFEEPLEHTDFDGYSALKAKTDIPIAMGEREFDCVALRELSRRGAIDMWQPDILRLGGVGGWLESAELAESAGLPVLPHYYKEYDVPLLMTVKNARGAESFDWVDPLIDNPIRMENGFAYPHDGPGWGFRFRDAFLSPL